jgi:hypothetical protein
VREPLPSEKSAAASSSSDDDDDEEEEQQQRGGGVVVAATAQGEYATELATRNVIGESSRSSIGAMERDEEYHDK